MATINYPYATDSLIQDVDLEYRWTTGSFSGNKIVLAASGFSTDITWLCLVEYY